MTLRRVAPGKINLGLHVLRRRADGFHDVETVLVPIGWHDVLEFEPGGERFRFSCSDPSLPTNERNLCVRAARLLGEKAGVAMAGHLRLEKHLPHAAGLGGGSADAAATLLLLSEHLEMERGNGGLDSLAAELGSDVPFFLQNQPMLASGRGDILEPLSTEGYELPFAIAVVMPPVSISTAEAYQMVDPSDEQRPDLRALVKSNDLVLWWEELRNDFEEPIVARHPEIAAERDALIEAGARYVALSGSGAAVFGLFEQLDEAHAAVDSALGRGRRGWAGDAAGRGRTLSEDSRRE